MEEKQSSRLASWAAPAGLFVFSLLLYLPSLWAPFTSDDILVTTENPMLGDLSKLGSYFTSELDWLVPEELAEFRPAKGHSGVYRPILAASYHLDYLLFGLEPAGWRFVNALLHAGCALLAFALLSRLLTSKQAALLAAAVFAAHPMHVEAVSSLFGGRAELLAGFFVICGWLAFLRADKNSPKLRRASWLAVSAGFLLLGLFSKENAVVLPALCLFTAWGLQRRPARIVLLELLPQLAVVAIYATLRISVVGGLAASDWSFAFGWLGGVEIFLAAMAILARYLFMTVLPFFPTHPDCLQDFPQRLSIPVGMAATVFVLAVIVLAVVFFLRGRSQRKANLFSGSILVFFLCLIPVSHIVPFAVVMAQRFLFLPSLAFALVVGWFWLHYCQGAYLRYTVPALILALFSAATVAFGFTASDPDKMYRLVMECRPQSADAYNNLGTFRLRQGKIAEALELFEAAIGKDPQLPDPLYNKGLCLQKLGRALEAEGIYRQVLQIAPSHPMAPNNLGVLLSARGRLQEAASFFELAIRNDPAHPEPVVNLAILREQEGNLDEAERLFRLALKMDRRLEVAREGLSRIEKLRQPPPSP